MSKHEMTGIYQASGRGYGFFVPEDGGEDWFVPPHRQATAWDGDRVRLREDAKENGPGHRKVGAVTAVLERVNHDVVGTVRKQGRQLWLEPDNKRLPVILVLSKRGKVGSGEKAAVTVTSFGGRNEPPVGRLTETFGRAGTRQASVDATLYR